MAVSQRLPPAPVERAPHLSPAKCYVERRGGAAAKDLGTKAVPEPTESTLQQLSFNARDSGSALYIAETELTKLFTWTTNTAVSAQPFSSAEHLSCHG